MHKLFHPQALARLYGGVIIFMLLLAIVSPPGGGGDPDETWEKLIRKAEGEGDYLRALDYLRRIEANRPRDETLRNEKIRLLTLLGQQAIQKKEFIRAEESLGEALQLDRRNYLALKMLGDIAYYSQRLEEAESLWKEALAIHPADPELIQKLKLVAQEAAVEGKLDSSVLPNFDIRFHAGHPDYSIHDIQGYLLDAYREIGYDFKYFPNRSIVVILYNENEFERLRRTPSWVGAIYDGKIRLPVGKSELQAADFQKILWHEYTHALIHDLAGSNCPRWLHEGLAQYQEAKVGEIDLGPLAERAAGSELLPLMELDSAFAFDQSDRVAALAYAQAYSLVDYLIRRYGFFRIKLILERLGRGEEWERAVAEELLLTPPELEDAWRTDLL